MILIEYPKCSTCKKAKAYLDNKKFKYEDRDIKIKNPSKEELIKYIKLSGKDINKFFNTSGLLYKSMNLKDKLKNMTDDEKLDILSSDGMLVKRPLLVLKDKVLVGFKIDEWNSML